MWIIPCCLDAVKYTKWTMLNRWLIAVFGIIVLLAALYMFTARDTSQDLMGKDATGLSIATDAVRFVDSALDENTGYFHLTYECSSESAACTPVDDPDKPPHSGYAILSLKRVGGASGNEAMAAKADTVLDKAIERCQSDSRFCEWNFFPLHIYYKETGDQKYKDAMMKVVESVMKERPLKELIDNNIPVKWWRLYDATGEERYKKHLLDIADKELAERTAQKTLGKTVYTTKGNYEVRSYDMPVIWALYVPAYLASKDERYLRFIQDFYEAADIENNTNYFWGATDTGNLIKGLEAMLMIADEDASRADMYRTKVRVALEALMKDRWDTPDNKKFNGDYGFLVSPTGKATNIQGWIIALFMSLKDEEFAQ